MDRGTTNDDLIAVLMNQRTQEPKDQYEIKRKSLDLIVQKASTNESKNQRMGTKVKIIFLNIGKYTKAKRTSIE